MISKRQLPELRNYARVERRLPMRELHDFADLVVPNGNASRPGHRWFKYKEAFSASFVDTVFELLGMSTTRDVHLLDPYCGVGTTLLSSQLLSARGYRVTSVG